MKATALNRVFSIGDAIANVTILECVSDGIAPLQVLSTRAQQKTKYRIRYECCGRDTILSHRAIVDRAHTGQLFCSACSGKYNRAVAAGAVEPVQALNPTDLAAPTNDDDDDDDGDQRPALMSSEYAALVAFHAALSFPHLRRIAR